MCFDVDTDSAGRGGKNFDCSSLFEFPGVAGTSCALYSDALVVATLDATAVVVPSDTLATRTGVLNNYCVFSDFTC